MEGEHYGMPHTECAYCGNSILEDNVDELVYLGWSPGEVNVCPHCTWEIERKLGRGNSMREVTCQ